MEFHTRPAYKLLCPLMDVLTECDIHFKINLSDTFSIDISYYDENLDHVIISVDDAAHERQVKFIKLGDPYTNRIGRKTSKVGAPEVVLDLIIKQYQDKRAQALT